MEMGKIVANVGLYTVGVILSLGPSQIYGVVKGTIDLCKMAILKKSIANLKSEGKDLHRHKITQLKGELKAKEVSLKADAVALIPGVGAILSWRVLAPVEHRTTLNAIKGIKYATAHMLNDFEGSLKVALYPGNRVDGLKNELENHRLEVNAEIEKGGIKGAKLVEIPVSARGSGQKLEAIEMKHSKEPPPPTVVIFHGNAMIGQSMMEVGKYYYQNGFNVLMPTMGGYPGSSESETSEDTSYQDVEAVKEYLIKNGVKDVAYHGTSIGGSLAFQAATANTSNTSQLNIKFVVADQTFASAKSVMAMVVRNAAGGFGQIAKGVAFAAAPLNRKVFVGNGEYVETDGLDNLKKAGMLKSKNIPLYAVESSQDALMKSAKNPHKNAAGRLIRERYGDEGSDHLIHIRGGHGAQFNPQKLRAGGMHWNDDFVDNAPLERFMLDVRGSGRFDINEQSLKQLARDWYESARSNKKADECTDLFLKTEIVARYFLNISREERPLKNQLMDILINEFEVQNKPSNWGAWVSKTPGNTLISLISASAKLEKLENMLLS